MKILFLTDNFPPESNAPAIRTYEHCLEWVEQGAEVTVITCAPNFPSGKVHAGYRNKWRQEEMMDGIRVIRVWSYITPNRGLTKRILDYLSFCFTGFLASLRVKSDVIVATSPQLFTAVAGYLASFFKRTPWVMEIRDLWPESIKAVGAIETSRVIKVLDRLVNFLYHRADRLVVVTDAFKKRMETLGVPPEKVKVVKNGVHIHQYQGVTRNEDLVKQYGLDGKFVVAYIGTHGMAHKLDFILDSAQHVKEKDIHFLFIGDGAFKSRLLKQLAALKLSNVTMLAPIPKSEVPEHIALADVALINLRKQKTFEKVLPSKIFENAAMGKPILLGVNGEARALVEHYGAGLYYEPENQADFLAQLTKLYQQRNNFAPYQAACLQLAQDFDRKRLAVNMFHILVDLHTEARPTTEPVPNMRLTDPIATYSTTPTVDTENQEPLNEHEVAE